MKKEFFSFDKETKHLQTYGILSSGKGESYLGHWHKERLSIFKLLRENGWKYKHINESLYIYCTLPNGETISSYIRKQDGLQGIEELGNINYYNDEHKTAYKKLGKRT